MPKRNLVFLLIVAGVAAAAILFVSHLESRFRAQEAESRTLRKMLRQLESEVLAYRLLDVEFPDLKKLAELIEQARHEHQLTPEQLTRVTEGGIKGRIEALREEIGDPYLRYVPRAEKETFYKRIKGVEAGLGLQVKVAGGVAKVAGVLGGSPAHRAGVVPGDVIVAIGGTDVADMEEELIKRSLRGASPRAVKLTVRRAKGVATEGAAEQVTLSAAEFTVRTVEGLWRDEKGAWVHTIDPDDRIYYLRITEFVESTRERLEEAMRKLPSPEGVVLDLRGNPGGLPESAAEVTNLFLSEGQIFTIVNIRDGKPSKKSFVAHKGGTYAKDVPIVVLIDGGTSSAAEIVAGAMRVHGRAALVGSRTRGKTRVQDVWEVPDLGLIVASTGRFYLGGRTGTNSGPTGLKYVDPDVPVKIDERVQEELSRFQARAAALPEKPPFKPLPSGGGSLAEELRRLDAQLAMAVALLKDPPELARILKSACRWAGQEEDD